MRVGGSRYVNFNLDDPLRESKGNSSYRPSLHTQHNSILPICSDNNQWQTRPKTLEHGNLDRTKIVMDTPPFRVCLTTPIPKEAWDCLLR